MKFTSRDICFVALGVTAHVLPGMHSLHAQPRPQTITVSPYGPVRSLGQAREEARLWHRKHPTARVKVVIKEGTYVLPETLQLGLEDSNVTWEAAPGEHPVISGGEAIQGWVRGNDDVWSAHAPNVHFHQLFVDGRRATRARTPNYGFFRMKGASSEASPFELHYSGNDIQGNWGPPEPAEIVALLAWSDFRMPISRVDATNSIATLTRKGDPYALEQDARYFVENTRDSLDMPGEWFLDKTKSVVNLIPFMNEGMERTVAVAPPIVRLVTIEGDPTVTGAAHDITFRGLAFEYADWTMDKEGYVDRQAESGVPAAIETRYVKSIVFDRCTMAHLGGYAVSFGRGTKNSRVILSDLYDLGAGGIKVGDEVIFSADSDQSYGNAISDNDIHGLGSVYPAGVGVLVLQSSRNQITHNHIHDLFYTGISVGWTWGYGDAQAGDNLIAFNHVHDVGKGMLSDMGGIYTLGKQPGTSVMNNLVHDISSFAYGGWGIYTDEGSSNIRIQDNVAYNCSGAGFHHHFGQDNLLRNNIFAFNGEDQLLRSDLEPHPSFTFDQNIVYFDRGNLLTGNWKDNNFTISRNVYFDTRSKGTLFAGMKFAEWKKIGNDAHSVIADPLFVDANAFDFRLRPGSPALKLGFHQIDLSTVGPRSRVGAQAWP